MANLLPTLAAVRHKGSGNVQVHDLVGGISIPTQDGMDVLVGTLEAPHATNTYNHANRVAEFKGKRFLLHGHRIYERDNGGAGTWGVIASTSGFDQTSEAHSGLHVLYPNGVPTLAYIVGETPATNSFTVYRIVKSTDGVTFTSVTVARSLSANKEVGASVVYKNSIFWFSQGGGVGRPNVFSYDFVTATPTQHVIAAILGDYISPLLVHKSNLYLTARQNGSHLQALVRWDGSVWTIMASVAGTFGPREGQGAALFSDGWDIISIWGNDIANSKKAVRFANVGIASIVQTDITATVLSGVTSTDHVRFSTFTCLDPDPPAITTYFWWNAGTMSYNTDTWACRRYNYRRISHGAVTGAFIAHEYVEQAVTGARGRIMETDGATYVELTDVTGAFDAVNVITGDDSGAQAAASSLLVERSSTSIGSSVSAVNFGLPQTSEAGPERITAYPAARVEPTGIPSEVPGGLTRWTFRCYGTGAALSFRVYIDIDGVASPDTLVQISAVAVASGAPATVPSVSGGNQIDNLTPDDGVATYTVDLDIDALGISPGGGYTLIVDPV